MTKEQWDIYGYLFNKFLEGQGIGLSDDEWKEFQYLEALINN